MIECLIGVVVGFVMCMIAVGRITIPAFVKKPSEKAREPTEEEQRKAKRELQEYINFMTYDGTPQDTHYMD